MSVLPGTLPPAGSSPGATSSPSSGGRGAAGSSDGGFADLLRAALPDRGAAHSRTTSSREKGADEQATAEALPVEALPPEALATESPVPDALAADVLAASLLAGTTWAGTALAGATLAGTTLAAGTDLTTDDAVAPALTVAGAAAVEEPTTTLPTPGLATGDSLGQLLDASVAQGTNDTTTPPVPDTAGSVPGDGTEGGSADAPGSDAGAATDRGPGTDRPAAAASDQGTTRHGSTSQGTTGPAGPSAPTAPGGAVDLQGLTPVSAPAAASPATAGNAATSTASPSVTSQVFGEVGRLVARGDGTHRMTLTLNPEALGEVRVTLTVRQGEVTVSFAAGDEAQRALLEGAPELRRLLELSGATESRITVRDSSGGPGSQGSHQPQTQSDGQGDSSSGRAADAGGTDGQDADARPGTPDQHARMRDGQPATDGTHRGPGATRLPHDPVTSTRAAGLDVTL